MTILELCRLVRKYWIIAVVVPVICILVCAGYFLVNKSENPPQSAVSRIVTNSQVAVVYGHSASLAREATAAYSGYTASAKADSSSSTVSITVTGPDVNECIQFANTIAADAVAATKRDFVENENSEYKTAFHAYIEDAKQAHSTNDSGIDSGILKYVAMALLGGLFVSICIIVIIDLKKRLVKSAESAQDLTGVPVMETMPAKDGRRLLANIRFAVGDDVRSICIIAVGGREGAENVRDLLSGSLNGEQVEMIVCSAHEDEVGAYYDARKCDSTVIVVRELSDSQNDLSHVVNELRLADVEPICLVYSK